MRDLYKKGIFEASKVDDLSHFILCEMVPERYIDVANSRINFLDVILFITRSHILVSGSL